MVFLDTQILFVAFADIRASFPDVSTTTMSWVLSGYTLVFAALLVPAGRLADRWGRKAVFLWRARPVHDRLGGVRAGADRRRSLIAARVAAGRRRGGDHADVAGPRAAGDAAGAGADRRRHLGLDGRRRRRLRPDARRAARRRGRAGAGCSSSTCRCASWRSSPGGGCSIESREADPGPFPDLVGSALLAAGVGAVSLALVQSDDWGWVDGRTIGAIAIGLVLTALFVARSQRQPAPALDLSLFRIPSFRWGNLATAAFGLSFTAMFLANVTYLTTVWQWDIVKAGLAMAPGPLVVLLLARRFGRLAARIGPRPLIIAGGLVYALGGVDPRAHRRADAELRHVDAAGVADHRARRRPGPAAAVERQRAGAAGRTATPSARPSTRRCASSAPRSGWRSSSRSSPAPPRPTPCRTSSGRGG